MCVTSWSADSSRNAKRHHVGASAPANPQLVYHFYRSLLRYFRRYRPGEFEAMRAVMLLGFGARGLIQELARLFGRPAAHPWWRLAALCAAPESRLARSA